MRLIALAAVLPFLLAGAAVPAQASTDAERELAETYAPVVVVRAQPEECGEGEPYLPVPVDTVLGRDDVVLRGPDGEVVTAAPTAADLFGRGNGYYLDLPGDPLEPGCDYEQWFRAIAPGVDPAVYARITADPAHPGQLVLQYWFWWVFNDWNDKHEGDWEMVQLLFDAATPEEALARGPTSTAYAQHEGSQTAVWTGSSVLRDGTHPAVYPGQGSHAAYYTQSDWFGRSAAAGFGCDDTTAPGTVLRPRVLLMPDDPVTDPAHPYAWLAFDGRWGERAPSFNNGPTGPNTKQQWSSPVTWVQDKGRADAVALPPLPGEAGDAFCGLTAAGSLLFIELLARPWVVAGALLALAVLAVVAVRRTRWHPADPDPIDTERRSGQIVVAAVRTFRAHPGLLAPLGGVLLATTTVVALVQSAILAPRPSGDLADVDGTLDAWPHVAAGLVGLLVALPVTLLVVAAVAHGLAASPPSGGLAALRRSARHPAAAVAVLVQWAVPGLLAATVLLLPVGAWLAARWAVAFPAAAVEGLGTRAALHRSAGLTAGHRWRTLVLTLVVLSVAVWTGPLLGALVLLLTGSPFWVANLLAGLVTAVTLPVLGAAMTMQFLDLRRRAAA